MKPLNYLNDPYMNVISVIVLTIISYILILSMNLSGKETEELINLFYPSLVAMGTLVVYFVSRLCFKKYNWLISCAGSVYMFYISILLNWNTM
jgi:hypothetical protein